MFLIRTAFWLTLVILLLPTGEEEQRTVYGTAEAAVNDMRTFCTRNPDVCAKSRDAFEVFSQKAKFGAKMLVDFVSDVASDSNQETAAADQGRRFPTAFRGNEGGTLTSQDMEPGWFGPSSDSNQETAAADQGRRFPTAFRGNEGGTLTSQDMEPGWFGPSSDSGV